MTAGQIAYRQYLQSDHWRSLRLQAFRVHGRKCYKCPKKFGLDIHHLRYRWPWESCVVEDVRPCCRECHEQEHGIVKEVPRVEQSTIQKMSNRMKKRIKKAARSKLKYLRRKAHQLEQKKAKIYYYTKPYTKRRKWVNRDNSSN